MFCWILRRPTAAIRLLYGVAEKIESTIVNETLRLGVERAKYPYHDSNGACRFMTIVCCLNF